MHPEMEKRILVIENNVSDAIMIRQAFDSLEGCGAYVCRNVSEARAYIQGAGMYKDRTRFPFPDAIVCDLNLGDEAGYEFMTWIKNTKDFDGLRVIFLGGSTAEDLLLALKLGITEIVPKPSSHQELKEVFAEIASKLCG